MTKLGKDKQAPLIRTGLLFLWLLAISFLPNPCPLSAPAVAVESVETVLKVGPQEASMLATVALRGMGMVIIGLLVVQVLKPLSVTKRILSSLLLAPLLAVLSLWVNYGYFPIRMQLFPAIVSAWVGVAMGLIFLRTRGALVGLVLFASGLFIWGTATGISDDFYEITVESGLHILQNLEEIPAGDAGFEKLLELSFAFAEENSHHRDPVEANRAAILALSTILGEEKVAKVAKRGIGLEGLETSKQLRKRITVYGRHDLSRHFWVSAGLAILSNDATSMNIGIAKEMMDSAGGSGFSFVDLSADRAGTLFCLAATRDESAARAMQDRIRNGAHMKDFIPNTLDLPEGISNDRFQKEYGGLGGNETQAIVEDIITRLNSCNALK